MTTDHNTSRAVKRNHFVRVRERSIVQEHLKYCSRTTAAAINGNDIMTGSFQCTVEWMPETESLAAIDESMVRCQKFANRNLALLEEQLFWFQSCISRLDAIAKFLDRAARSTVN
jgi:hypothetical protein